MDAIGIVGRVDSELIARELPEIGACPLRSDQQVMRAAERRQAAVEALDKVLIRGRMTQCLVCDRLDNSERVLDPMGELAQQQRLPLFPQLALGDVAGALKGKLPAVHVFEQDAA